MLPGDDRHTEVAHDAANRPGPNTCRTAQSAIWPSAEVADLVAILARDDGGHITAQEIGIDGGLGLNTLFVGPRQAMSSSESA